MTTTTETLMDVLADALVSGKGYTREAADHTVDFLRESSAAGVRLTSAVEHVLKRTVDDPDWWDGDEDAVTILTDFLEWMPDLPAHQVADRLRKYADRHSGIMVSSVTSEIKHIADQVDPFQRGRDQFGPCWKRKRDGAQVPERVAKLDE